MRSAALAATETAIGIENYSMTVVDGSSNEKNVDEKVVEKDDWRILL